MNTVNRQRMLRVLVLAALASSSFVTPAYAAFEPLQSPRLERAKDYIADEQWERAIEQLKAAAADAKERNKDEALFWLAHSQNQARDLAAAVETISRLERDFASSRWVKPARSLRIEIAQKLRRNDVLWWTARPPSPPMPAAAPLPPPTPATVAAPTPMPSARPRVAPAAATPAPPSPPPTPARTVAPPRPPRAWTPFAAPQPPQPSAMWIPEGWDPDTNLRIQALGSLIQTDATRVIPILKEIALESVDANEVRRAIFVLAQSGRPEAQSTVVEVAKQGTELVQIAAVRELGRFGGPEASEALLQVYSTGNPRVKYQVVNSLGERSATTALMRIAETERDHKLQETAIVRLGQAGAREPLARFYSRAGEELKRPIIDGLFNARAEEELIRIAEMERDVAIRAEVLTRLQLLGTEKARLYLEKQRKNR
jgi:HEAT repeat protein